MPTCLYSLASIIIIMLVLCVSTSGTAMLPELTSTFRSQEGAADSIFGLFNEPNLALSNDFIATHMASNSNINNRLHISDTARCFSCMSRLYEAVWPALASIYKRPKNFTDLCDDSDLDPYYVPYTNCPTICIRMWEDPTVAGVRIRGHIRGCLDDLLYNGFNQTIVNWYRWMHRDSCRQYRKRELFKLPPELSDDSYITVCTCYADYCNGKSSSGGSMRNASQCSLIVVLLYSLVLFPIQRISHFSS